MAANGRGTQPVPRRVIVDIDAGTDDALALMLLLTAQRLKQVEIVAITCVHGNTDMAHVYANVRRVLRVCDAEDVAVYLGAREPLLAPDDTHTALHFHGRDGFGDLQYEQDNVTVQDTEGNRVQLVQRVFARGKGDPQVTTEPAPVAMNRLVTEHAGQVSLLCLGPLTNVALALKVYGHFGANVRDIFLMGGNHKGVGNVTSAAEFNFHTDPEAAYIVLQYARCPITVLPCTESTISFDWRYNTLGKSSHPAIELLTAAERRVYGHSEPFWLPCDAFLAAVLLQPAVARARLDTHASVELQGHSTRAQMVIDHMKHRTPNVTVVTELDFQLFQSMLQEMFM